ncbi:hypothetical protein [Mycobacterium aquaticum]|nr:hypothetical protein [Mycobacterium aquaticum]
MGDEPADEKRIPDEFAFLADDKRAHIQGYIHVNANYLLTVDNLMDLSHALYLHAGVLTNAEQRDNFVPQARLVGDVVACEREQPGIAPPGQWVEALPPEVTKVDFYSHVYWHAPSAVIHPFGCRVPENPDAGASAMSAHFFTPETETTTHYFYHNTRDYQVDSAETNAKISELLERVFTTQDVPMIEAQQQVIGNVDLMSLHPVVLQTDRATVLMRRVLNKLITKEQSASATANQPVAAGSDSQ